MDLGGSKKQSGKIFPLLSASLLAEAGKIAIYFSNSKTALSKICCTPVVPNLSKIFIFMSLVGVLKIKKV